MAPYLTVEQFKLKAVIPPSFVAEIESEQPGWTLESLTDNGRWIDARLRKRYGAPFPVPYPEQVLTWLARIVALEVLIRRGIDPTDRQFQSIADRAAEARSEVKEAADGVVGLFDLPVVRDGKVATAISKGGPLVYSEASPYVWGDGQRTTGRNEDSAGRGTGNG